MIFTSVLNANVNNHVGTLRLIMWCWLSGPPYSDKLARALAQCFRVVVSRFRHSYSNTSKPPSFITLLHMISLCLNRFSRIPITKYIRVTVLVRLGKEGKFVHNIIVYYSSGWDVIGFLKSVNATAILSKKKFAITTFLKMQCDTSYSIV